MKRYILCPTGVIYDEVELDLLITSFYLLHELGDPCAAEVCADLLTMIYPLEE